MKPTAKEATTKEVIPELPPPEYEIITIRDTTGK
jgi:hypothetical protein